MLELVDVSKKYRRKKAVDGISFSVEPGQILGLIGSNGAGKSTTISMIATVLKPDGGKILFDGEDIAEHPEAIRKKLGYVPQDIALYETLSGLDNLKFFGKTYGVRGAELKKAIERVGKIIALDRPTLKKRVSEYSGGMKRRLNIGVALLHDPGLVILDEPTTGIDVTSGRLILDAIEELKAAGTAVIYVGHYLEEVERICTHLCIMDKGKVLAYGTKEELLNGAGGRKDLAALYEEMCGKRV